MTQDEIIVLWSAAGGNEIKGMPYSIVEAFAKLVTAKEREACAKVCEDDDNNAGEWHWEAHVGGYFAKAIRARGEA